MHQVRGASLFTSNGLKKLLGGSLEAKSDAPWPVVHRFSLAMSASLFTSNGLKLLGVPRGQKRCTTVRGFAFHLQWP